MDPKERMKIPRQKMPEQDPKKRGKNFDEVPYGYNSELAVMEATRCIQCKKPGCVAGCPVEIDIPGFIKLIAEKEDVRARPFDGYWLDIGRPDDYDRANSECDTIIDRLLGAGRAAQCASSGGSLS